jgi:hypothetical protein
MDFLTAIRIMLARWYVLVPALLATGIASLGVMSLVAPAYRVQSSMILLAPASKEIGTDPALYNPYVGSVSLEVVADVIAKVTMSEATVARLKTKHATADYEVGTGLEGGPILNVMATSSDERTALRTAAAVTADIRRELAERQQAQGAPRKTWISAVTITPPDQATKMIGSKIRVLAAVLVLGLASTISLTFMAETIAEGRRRRAEVERAAEGWRSAARDIQRDSADALTAESSVSPTRR